MTNIIEILYKAPGFYELESQGSTGPFLESFQESAVYPMEKFMSDVGGTAGLMLGMSLATVIGLVDVLISKCMLTFFFIEHNIHSVIYKIMAREPVLEFENRQELKAMMDGLKVQRERMI